MAKLRRLRFRYNQYYIILDLFELKCAILKSIKYINEPLLRAMPAFGVFQLFTYRISNIKFVKLAGYKNNITVKITQSILMVITSAN